MVHPLVKILDFNKQGNRATHMRSGSFGMLMVAALASSLSLPNTFAQVKTASALPAGTPGAPNAAPQTQEIDIQAAEQDFAGDIVNVKGNVRVKSKDTIVTGPEAQIFKDASGQPQLAIFIGHPHLVQGKNKIEADKLTFEIATNKVIADGHAHSEVVGNDEPQDGASGGTGAAGAANSSAPAPGAAPNSASTAKGTVAKPKNGAPFEWPTADKDNATGHVAAKPVAQAPAPAPTPAPAPKPAVKKTDGNGWEQDDEADAQAAKSSTQAPAPPTTSGPTTKPPDKIVTDSDHQQYESESGHFHAQGNVHVKHLDMKVIAEQLNLVYGNDGKPETAVFTGNVSATQNDNNTKADSVTYFLSTQRLQASGNVRSKVLQTKQKSGAGSQEAPKKGGLTSPNGNQASAAGAGTAGGPQKNTLAVDRAKIRTIDPNSEEPIFILSDSQDYNKETGKMTAVGSVRVYYADNKGIGHKAVLLRNEDGKTQKITFYGRSQIIQPGKRWIGDRILFDVPNQKVVATGNTRAIILNTNAQVITTSTSSQEPATPSDQSPDTNTNSKVDAQLAHLKKSTDATSGDDGQDRNDANEMKGLIGDGDNSKNGEGDQISTTKVDPTR